MENCFWCYFRQLFIALAKGFNIPTNIPVQDFCPLKTEIAEILSNFVIKLPTLINKMSAANTMLTQTVLYKEPPTRNPLKKSAMI